MGVKLDIMGIMVDKLRELENKFELAIRREKEAHEKINSLKNKVMHLENRVIYIERTYKRL